MTTTIEYTQRTLYSPARAVLHAELPESGQVAIDIEGPRYHPSGEYLEARVNWPGIGSRPASDTRAFAQALLEAAEKAATLQPSAFDECVENGTHDASNGPCTTCTAATR